jgi:hypothetical protein
MILLAMKNKSGLERRDKISPAIRNWCADVRACHF